MLLPLLTERNILTSNRHTQKVAAFRTLHESGCFIMPNPWDIGTTRILTRIGFKALATTSAGYAFTRGLPDTVTALSLDEILAHFCDLVAATSLPINADFQHGYADNPEGVAANVTRCLETGVAGLSIEDACGDPMNPLYERSLAVERVAAAREAIDASGTGVVLTARCEAWLLGIAGCEEIALDRLAAFAEAGADCLYAPAVREPAAITRIVAAVSPKPVNVLISSPGPGLNLSALREMGVRRISVGSALAKAAWAAALRTARQMAETGEFDLLGEALSFGRLDDYLNS
jgi:2-methylisocitrate lyase-like PEP mutase family enzyme